MEDKPNPAERLALHLDISLETILSALTTCEVGLHNYEYKRRAGVGLDPRGRRTHCLKGHPLDAANIKVHPGAPNKRLCLICHKARRARQRKKMGELKRPGPLTVREPVTATEISEFLTKVSP